MKSDFKPLLTAKHQLRLLIQVLNEMVLPNYQFDESDAQALSNASDLISSVHTSLEEQFNESLEGAFND